MSTPAIMLQGTGSSVGKSLLVAGLVRAARRRGLRVLPFKPQNMSNNAAVTADGGEIGRAQALQARAAGVAPCVHMNPILLKPQSMVGSQVIVQGKIFCNAVARDYQRIKPSLLPRVLESFEYLKARADLVIVEGAGSPAEVNLRRGDIANMGFARATGTKVVLIGDIDRGGVIASVVGTKAVLDPEDAAMIHGFIINRIRGDARLFDEGMRFIATRTGWSPLGLVPFFDKARQLPAEDAADLARTTHGNGPLIVAVPMLPQIANFDDLDPLTTEPAVQLRLIPRGTPLPADATLVVLPGSKATIADLAVLRAEGWDIDLAAHHRRGGLILGLCGGYQFLGKTISDPEAIEGAAGTVPGLGLLDIDTVLTPKKTLQAVAGVSLADGASFSGYEMHVGHTDGVDTSRPVLHFNDGRFDGACSADGRVMGTYVHGLFAHDEQRAAWIARLGGAGLGRGPSYEALVESTLDELAMHLEAYIDIDKLLEISRS